MVSISSFITLLLACNTNAFTLSEVRSLSSTKKSPLIAASTTLYAKKNTSGKGFGKTPVKETKPTNTAPSFSNDNNDPFGSGLSSIETTTPDSFARPQIEIDENLSADERNKEILKQRFGLRSYEERQGDIRAAEKMAEQKQDVNTTKNT